MARAVLMVQSGLALAEREKRRKSFLLPMSWLQRQKAIFFSSIQAMIPSDLDIRYLNKLDLLEKSCRQLLQPPEWEHVDLDLDDAVYTKGRKTVSKVLGGGDAVRRMIESGMLKKVRTLRLKNFDNISALQISKGLRSGQLESLQNLEMSDCHAGEEEAVEIAAALRSGKLQSLQSLDLSSNLLGDRGTAELAGALQSGETGNLQQIRLRSNYLSHEGAMAIAAAFESGELANVTSLDLSDNAVGDEGTEAIADMARSGKMVNVRDINLKGNHLGDRGAMAIGAALQSDKLPNMNSLDLSNNNVGDNGATAIAVAAQSGKMVNLENIRLKGNRIRDGGAVAIGAAIQSGKLSNVLSLDLSDNFVGDEGATAIGAALQSGKLSNVLSLNLSDNFVGEGGATAIVAALQSGKLMNLFTVDLKGKDVDEGRLVGIARVLEMSTLPGSLQQLSILAGDTHVPTAAKVALIGAFKRNKTLTVNIFTNDFNNDLSFFKTILRQRHNNLEWVETLKLLSKEQDVPRTHAKVFICGRPSVGKTTLRLTLLKARDETLSLRHKLKSMLGISKSHEKVNSNIDPTRGIEVSYISVSAHDSSQLPTKLAIWDLAGQNEYEVLHSAFVPDVGLADGETTCFIIVCSENVPQRRPSGFISAKQDLDYWLRFIASNSSSRRSLQDVEGQQDTQPQVFVVVNCFHGVREGDVEERWRHYLNKQQGLFKKFLNLQPDPFIFDTRIKKEAGPLMLHLGQQVQNLLQGKVVPKVCDTLMEWCNNWSERHQKYPILQEQQYFNNVARGSDSLTLIEAATKYLHEVGHLIWFKRQASEESSDDIDNLGVVVLSTDYFCQKVVGNLLLPPHLLRAGERGLVELMDEKDSIPLTIIETGEFEVPKERLQEVVHIFLRIGIGYSLPNDERRLYIPTLIQRRGLPAWLTATYQHTTQAQSWVMGFCLVPKDSRRTLLPIAILRRLQVDLAIDKDIGKQQDSDYRADVCQIWFKSKGMGVFVEYSGSENPDENRLDILVKPLIDSSNDPSCGPGFERQKQVTMAHAIMQRVQMISPECCPGLELERRIVRPWKSTDVFPSLQDRNVQMSVQSVIGRAKENGLQATLQWVICENVLVKCQDVLGEEDLSSIEGELLNRYNLTQLSARELHIPLPQYLVEQDAEVAESHHNAKFPEITLEQQTSIILEAVENGVKKVVDRVDRMGEGLCQRTKALHKIVEAQVSLNRHVQSLGAFSVQQKQRSVPRFAYLARQEQGKRTWIKISKAFTQNFTLHFLCEAQHDDGKLHEVKNQQGVDITQQKEWVQKLSPILDFTLKVAFVLGMVAAAAVIPGLDIVPDIPRHIINHTNLVANSKMWYDQFSSAPGSSNLNPTSSDDGQACRGAALDVVREVLCSKKWSIQKFQEHVGLRKVCFRDSTCIRNNNLVVWICNPCYDKYGASIVDLGANIS